MKRTIEEEEEEAQESLLTNCPTEIQTHIILSLCNYHPDRDDWDEFMKLKSISRHYYELIESQVIPSVHSVSFNLLYSLPTKTIAQFQEIREFTIMPSKGINWTRQLSLWKKLTYLNLCCDMTPEDVVISGLTQLNTLVCGERTRDSDLYHLTNLTFLSLHSNQTIKDEGLSRLTNVTKLNIGIDDMHRLTRVITNKSLESLPKLKILYMRYASFCGLTYHHFSGLSQLTELHISHLDLGVGNFRLLTNLEILNIGNQSKFDTEDLKVLTKLKKLTFNRVYMRMGLNWLDSLTTLKNLRTLRLNHVFGMEGLKKLNQLTNLTELSLKDDFVVQDCHITNLVNLQILKLCKNGGIKGNSFSLLTNLTELDLRDNKNIVTRDILRLRKLKKVVEGDDRIHYYQI